jgi:hypothetical protein
VLRIQAQALAEQLSALYRQRQVLIDQLQRVQPSDVRGVMSQIADLDAQIAQVSTRLADVQSQIALRRTVGQRPVPSFPPRQNVDPMVGLSYAFICAVLMPLAIGYARRIWRGGKPAPVAAPHSEEERQRMERLEHAVDSIAIEVERISEGQRFITKIMADRPASSSSAPPPVAASDLKPGIGEASPFLALGAGPMEPIRVPERQPVKQTITPH